MANSQVERLGELPQRAKQTWQGGFMRLPGWVMEGRDKPFRPVTAIWASLQTGNVGIGEDPCPKEEADFAMAVDALLNFATGQYGGYRPGKLEVNDAALAEHLSGLLAEVGIRVEHRPRLLTVERHREELTRFMFKGRPVPPGYLQGKGVTVDRVRAFAEAAKLFYEAAPWQHLSNEDLIEIESPRPDAACRFAVVLGAGRDVFGLGFYRSHDDYWRSRDADGLDAAPVAAGGVWSLTLEDITSIPLADADLWEDSNLPVADEDAYPVAMHFEPPMRMRRPSADALAFFEGLMRALVATTEDEMDTGRWSEPVTTANGPAEYVLSLPFLLEPPDHRELFDHGLSDTRAMEALQAQMGRFLAEKDFASMEDANEAIKAEFIGKPLDPTKHPPRTPLAEAQDICFQAFDSVGRRRVALARQAIRTCPDCADAYVILAESTASPQEAGELYAAGVEAGRRALGEKPFQEDIGHFWGIVDTRPFMRALLGLAETQQHMEQFDDAIDGYQELLRLNPGDNQGARYMLLPLLLTRDRHEEAEALLAGFPDDVMATWHYCRALLSFSREGDAPGAREQLQTALAANRHVPECLLGDAEIDRDPSGYSIGSREEAVVCVEECGSAWLAVPGALDWLRAQAGGHPQRRGRPRGPTKE